MADIHEIKLLDILPPNIKNDPDIIAAAKAIDNDFYLLVNDVSKCILLPNIYNITDHNLLDLLAWDRHVDYYDSSLPTEKKQKIIDDSFRQHMRKGTPYAVEQLVSNAFDEGTMEEWFEYGDDPYYFRITTVDRITDSDKLQELIKAINASKNKRSWLRAINIKRENISNLNLGSFAHTNQNILIKQIPLPDTYESNNNIFAGAIGRQTVNIILKQIALPDFLETDGVIKYGVSNRQNNYIKLYTEV